MGLTMPASFDPAFAMSLPFLHHNGPLTYPVGAAITRPFHDLVDAGLATASVDGDAVTFAIAPAGIAYDERPFAPKERN